MLESGAGVMVGASEVRLGRGLGMMKSFSVLMSEVYCMTSYLRSKVLSLNGRASSLLQ
jgi:hypothetical protein